MSNQTALKLLFELRAVLDRIRETDTSLHEAVAHDVDRSIRLTDLSIAQLTQDESPGPADAEDDEED